MDLPVEAPPCFRHNLQDNLVVSSEVLNLRHELTIVQ